VDINENTSRRKTHETKAAVPKGEPNAKSAGYNAIRLEGPVNDGFSFGCYEE